MSTDCTTYSQYAQDQIVIAIMREKRGGVFVDVGAHDGVTFSNTYLLEKEYGWSGLCIEPLPEPAQTCARQRCVPVVQVATADKDGPATFCMVDGQSEMLSGLHDRQDKRHRKRIEKQIRTNGGRVTNFTVDCRRLDDILAEHKIDKVDYISIDVEGAEFATLKGFFGKPVSVEVFSIENNYDDDRVCHLMEEQGYVRAMRVCCDDFYVPAHKGNDPVLTDLRDRYGQRKKKRWWRFWR